MTDDVAASVRAYRARIDAGIAQGPFDADWDSIREGYEIPHWYRDGKFGIFIHWGAYSVPAFGSEWYARNMYQQGSAEFAHHVETYGPQTEFGYKDFIPQFTASAFDATEWAALFRRAGAQFVVPVAEHHDGFPMYDCGFSRWNAAEMGPGRDVIGELAAAVRAQSMVFGVSSHRAEHWFFQHGGTEFPSDVSDPANANLYGPAMPQSMPPNDEFLENWLVRTAELIDKYEPALIWFDWWIENEVFEPYLRQLAAYYYNRAAQWKRQVAINYKWDAFPPGTAIFDVERGQLAGIRAEFWQTDTAVQKNSWCYTENQDYKRLEDLVGDLVDIVSKNGALLLNIGPKADGTIPLPEQELLLGIGAWLSVNGEGIYGTRPAPVFGEGPTEVVEGSFNDTERQPFTSTDIRFTVRHHPRTGEVVYAMPLAWPAASSVTIGSFGVDGPLRREVGSVRLLGHEAELEFTLDDAGLTVQLPDGVRPNALSPAFRIAAKPPEGF